MTTHVPAPGKKLQLTEAGSGKTDGVSTLVLQSYRTHNVAPWIERCMGTVAAWASSRGYAYERLDDALFRGVPAWYRERVEEQILPMTDLARLLVTRDRLGSGWKRVLWVDADVVVFAPEAFAPDLSEGCLMCAEIWVARNRFRAVHYTPKVNNAVLGFTAGEPRLDRLIEASLTTVRESEGLVHKIAVGTRLLTAIHAREPWPLLREVAMISPLLAHSLFDGGSRIVRGFMRRMGAPLTSANLCASLANRSGRRYLGDDDLAVLVSYLLRTHGGVLRSET